MPGYCWWTGFFIANLSQIYPLPLKANNLEFTAIKSIFRVRSLSVTMNFICKTMVIIFSVYHSEVSFSQWGFILFGTGTELLILKCPRPAIVDVFLSDTLSKATCLFCFIKNSSWKLSPTQNKISFLLFATTAKNYYLKWHCLQQRSTMEHLNQNICINLA